MHASSIAALFSGLCAVACSRNAGRPCLRRVVRLSRPSLFFLAMARSLSQLATSLLDSTSFAACRVRSFSVPCCMSRRDFVAGSSTCRSLVSALRRGAAAAATATAAFCCCFRRWLQFLPLPWNTRALRVYPPRRARTRVGSPCRCQRPWKKSSWRKLHCPN